MGGGGEKAVYIGNFPLYIFLYIYLQYITKYGPLPKYSSSEAGQLNRYSDGLLFQAET
jgi:hypothetical protein